MSVICGSNLSDMYKILCKFAGEDKLVDSFTYCDNLEAAKKFADRWKQGCFTYDADAIEQAVVVAPCGEVVYEAR